MVTPRGSCSLPILSLSSSPTGRSHGGARLRRRGLNLPIDTHQKSGKTESAAASGDYIFLTRDYGCDKRIGFFNNTRTCMMCHLTLNNVDNSAD